MGDRRQARAVAGAQTDRSSRRPAPSVDDALVVKQVSFADGMPLGEAIRWLQSECPGFQAVIVHDPRYPDFNPSLPEMSLKNLPLGPNPRSDREIHSRTEGGYRFQQQKRPRHRLRIFRIRQTDLRNEPWFRRGRGHGGRGRGHGWRGAHYPPQPTVQVYRLDTLIRANAANHSKALNDILSLVQAALDAAGSRGSMMKLHAPTETLIFSGNRAQLEAITTALKALER